MTDEDAVFNKLKQVPFTEMIKLVMSFSDRHVATGGPINIQWDIFLSGHGWDINSYTDAYNDYLQRREYFSTIAQNADT